MSEILFKVTNELENEEFVEEITLNTKKERVGVFLDFDTPPLDEELKEVQGHIEGKFEDLEVSDVQTGQDGHVIYIE